MLLMHTVIIWNVVMHARSPNPEVGVFSDLSIKLNPLSLPSYAPAVAAQPLRVATRFGPSIDVRNRDVFKVLTNTAQETAHRHLAVVRIWNGDSCREMSSNDARIFSSQLIAAATHAESENSQGR